MDDDDDNEYGTSHPRKERRVSSSTQEGDYEYVHPRTKACSPPPRTLEVSPLFVLLAWQRGS
jgi:hypothetical protein